jgi:hypothetical protein
MKVNKLFPRIAIPFRFAIRRTVSLALIGAIAAVLCAATAQAQNTQITIEGVITNAGTVPGITVGDKYSMVTYYNPTQTPSSVSGTESRYSDFTLNTVVDDKGGNQGFGVSPGEELAVNSAPGANNFVAIGCCGTTGSAFALGDTTGTAFPTAALPTALKLADFSNAFVLIGGLDNGSGALGSITSIRVDDTGGIVPAFISAGLPDPKGKVPVLNGVTGSGILNLDIAFPMTLLTHGSNYIYTFTFEDVNFTGTCQASFTLTQIQFNKTVTLDSKKGAAFSCGPGTFWFSTFNGKVIPDFPARPY